MGILHGIVTDVIRYLCKKIKKDSFTSSNKEIKQSSILQVSVFVVRLVSGSVSYKNSLN